MIEIDMYFKQNEDCVGKQSTTTDKKFVLALFQLSHEVSKMFFFVTSFVLRVHYSYVSPEVCSYRLKGV